MPQSRNPLKLKSKGKEKKIEAKNNLPTNYIDIIHINYKFKIILILDGKKRRH